METAPLISTRYWASSRHRPSTAWGKISPDAWVRTCASERLAAPVAPVGPCGPVGPVGPGTVDAAPVAPVSPFGPCGPAAPVGPAGPGTTESAPRWLSRGQWIRLVQLLQSSQEALAVPALYWQVPLVLLAQLSQYRPLALAALALLSRLLPAQSHLLAQLVQGYLRTSCPLEYLVRSQLDPLRARDSTGCTCCASVTPSDLEALQAPHRASRRASLDPAAPSRRAALLALEAPADLRCRPPEPIAALKSSRSRFNLFAKLGVNFELLNVTLV